MSNMNSEQQERSMNGTQESENDKEETKEEEIDTFINENRLSNDELENLNLHAMSENNKFYLFIKE